MPAQPPKASFPPADSDGPGLLRRLREFALVGAGLAPANRIDAFVRLRDLQDAGIVNVSQQYLAGGGRNDTIPGGSIPKIVEPAIDLTPPPAPGGFQAISGITQIQFLTVAPVYRQGHGHARTRIYAAPASPLPTFADAVLYTDFPGNVGGASFDPASDKRFWAAWVSKDGVESAPAGGTNGIAASTGLLEDQHIANLVVTKLLAGELAVGQYIQSADYVAGVSGWRIQTLSGGGAFLEINGGGIIGGSIIENNNIRSSNYVLGVSGWKLGADGTGQVGGVRFTVDGIQSNNYNPGVAGFRFDYNGAMTATGMNLYGGTLNAGSIIAGSLRNSTDSVNLNLNATGTSLVLRAGPLTYYGSLAGWHYPVEINADGSGFFGRGIVAGGTVKASGTYTIPDEERPAVIFFDTAPAYTDSGGSP